MSIQLQFVLSAIVVAVVGYLCGCFNGSVIVSKYILHNDVRTHGSGNAGLTNFYRVFGGPLTFVVILTDVLKAVVAVWIGILAARAIAPGFWSGDLITLGKFWAGAFCLVGHMFPCMFDFKGGKGILSGGTIAIMIDWRVALIAWGCFLILSILTKWVSLGSCVAAATLPVSTWLFYDPWCTVMAAVCGGLILWKHRGNMQRLLNGTESKFSFHRKKEAEL